ncbi:MAG: hypothetical protein IT438_15500 [Phycisphaerales bacterium]|nr:hypothetical protein [Phycisphaerales bacterium]
MNRTSSRYTLAAALAALSGSTSLAAPPPCPFPCRADWNQNCSLTVQDIFDYLADYFNGDGSFLECGGATSVQDLFNFLAAYFAGCDLYKDLALMNFSTDGAYIVPNCGFEAVAVIENSGTCTIFGPHQVSISGWLSIDGSLDPFDLWVGTRTATLPTLAPGATYTAALSNLFAQPPVFIGEHTLFFCVDSNDALLERTTANNCRGEPRQVLFADAFVSNVSIAPPNLVSGETATVSWRVHNPSSCDFFNVPTSACLGGVCCTRNITLPANSTVDVSCSVTIPATQADCGGLDPLPLGVCVNLPGDPDSGNNCQNSTVQVEDAFFDLRPTIRSEPSCAAPCTRINWTVRVTNTGNAPSPRRHVLTGVNCDDTPFVWGCTLGIVNITVEPIPAQSFRDYQVRDFVSGGYLIFCNASQQTQFIKAEVCGNCGDTPNGVPADGCSQPSSNPPYNNNNVDIEPIDITFNCP